MNPYVFIVGCPRSGTTLVGRICDAHPLLAVIHETRWIADWYRKRRGMRADGSVTKDLTTLLHEDSRFPTLGLDREAIDRLIPRYQSLHYADFVTSLFDLYGQHQGKPMVGDKTPRYVRDLLTLHELWPDAKVVHVIRDGRDVCLSVLEWRKGAVNFTTWEQDPVSTTALWWEWNVEVGRQAAPTLGPGRYHEVRYEALVTDPERECQALCDFLGLPYHAMMVRFHEGRTVDDTRLDAKKAWRPITAGLRSWRTDMRPEDIVRFEAAAGGMLEHLGYELGAQQPGDEFVARARMYRSAFERDLRGRGSPVPESWQSAAT